MGVRLGDKYQPLGRNDPLNPGKVRPHYGQDFPADAGTPIVANRPLEVVKNSYQYDASSNSGWGNYVTVRDVQTGTEYKMAHLDTKPDWKPGQIIPAGATVGHVGSTGGSTGAHLHYEAMVNGKFVDPQSQVTPVTWNKEGKGTLWDTLNDGVKDPNYKVGVGPTKPSASSNGNVGNDPIADIIKKKEEADKKKAQKEKESTQQNNKRTSPEGNRPRRGKQGTGLTSGSPWHGIGDGG